MPRDDPRPIEFFVDRALGSRKVAQALIAAGEVAHVHDELFAQDTLDVEWIPTVGARGWFVLTKDDALRRRVAELLAIRAASLGVFALARASLTGDEMAEVFVAALPSMKAIARRKERPFVAGVLRDGGVRMRLTAADLFRV